MNYEGFIDNLGLWVVSWRRVYLAAVLTTLGAILIATSLFYSLFPDRASFVGPHVVPTIVILTAFPLCVFVWSLVLRNSQLSTEMRRIVNRDRLTDVATRDYFFERMEAAPESYGVSLMLDIDHFKAINDTHGHLAGDLVIQRVAQVLKKTVRANDIICRFGGEEFIVFLADHGRTDGLNAAERMRASIADEEIQLEQGELVRVTVSIGGSIKSTINDINNAIREADAAMYRAKAAGRNQIVFASDAADTVVCVAI